MLRKRFLHLAPLLLPFLLFFVFGIGGAVLQSMAIGIPGVGLSSPFDAYREVLSSGWFWKSFFFSLRTALVSALIATSAGTVIAAGIYRLPRPASRFGSMYILPLILPHITVAFLVKRIFDSRGILSSFLLRIGLVSGPDGFPDFFFDGSGAALIIAYVYKEIPFVILMVLAMLKKLDTRQIDCGLMLGASRLRIFFKIILPSVMPAVLSAFIIIFIYSLGAFDIPFLIGESSPSMLSISIFNLYFQREIANRPAAMVHLIILLAVSLLSLTVYFRTVRKYSDPERLL